MTSISEKAQVFLDRLDELDDPAWCTGDTGVGPLSIALPDRTQPLDSVDLEAWLIEYSEPAPFGDQTGTRIDKAVRDTRRMKARGEVRVAGFDPSAILEEIARALGCDCRLAAELLDVLVYPPGARFVAHKDTPRYDDQLGTLIVELPHAHRGGQLRLEDGDRTSTIDWAGTARLDRVRWVALFGDVDHEVQPVTEGMRITAVYTLRYCADERLATEHRERMDAVIDAAIGMYDEWQTEELAIPCARMIVAPRDATFPLTHAVLRGADRLIAAALERAGIAVTVRACIAVADSNDMPLVDAIEDARNQNRAVLLDREIPDDMFEESNAIAWHPDPGSDYGHTIAAIAPYVGEEAFPRRSLLVRKRVRLPGKDMAFSHTGYFGNEYSEYYCYRFAMMLVDVPVAVESM